MSIFLKGCAAALLLFNGIGALYGGWALISDPTGSALGLPLSNLQHTPFDSYIIPGIILFALNGIFSLVVFVALVFNYKHAPKLILAQGCILTGWIVIQLLMIRGVHWLHILFGSIGIILIVIGMYMPGKRN